MAIVLSLCGIWIIGWLMTRLILQKAVLHWALGISISWMLGVGFFSLQLFIYGLLRIPWQWWWLIAPWLFLVLVLRKYRKLQIKPKLVRPTFEQISIGLVALILSVLIAYPMLHIPAWSLDGWLIWDFKAQILFHFHTLPVFSLQNNGLAWSHLDYPLLTPLVQAWLYTVSGTIQTTIPKIIYPLFYGNLLLALYGLLVTNVKNRVVSLLFMLILASSPILIKNSQLNYADLPLSIFILLAIGLLYESLKEWSREYVWLGALCLGLAAWTKNEGVIVWCLAWATYLFCSFPKVTKDRITIILAFSASLLLWLPWFIYTKYHHLELEHWFQNVNIQFIQGGGSRFHLLFAIVRGELERPAYGYLWYIFALSIIAVLLFMKIQNRIFWFPKFCVLGGLFLYFLIYFFTPQPLVWHLETSLERLLFQWLPSTLFVIALTSEELLRLTEKNPNLD